MTSNNAKFHIWRLFSSIQSLGLVSAWQRSIMASSSFPDSFLNFRFEGRKTTSWLLKLPDPSVTSTDTEHTKPEGCIQPCILHWTHTHWCFRSPLKTIAQFLSITEVERVSCTSSSACCICGLPPSSCPHNTLPLNHLGKQRLCTPLIPLKPRAPLEILRKCLNTGKTQHTVVYQDIWIILSRWPCCWQSTTPVSTTPSLSAPVVLRLVLQLSSISWWCIPPHGFALAMLFILGHTWASKYP